MRETRKNQQPDTATIIREWELSHIRLFTKNAGIICVLLMILVIPIDLWTFPENSELAVIRLRLVYCAFVLLALWINGLGTTLKAGARVLLEKLVFVLSGFAINGLYLYFLLTLDREYAVQLRPHDLQHSGRICRADSSVLARDDRSG